MDPFIGELKLVGFTYPPRGWAACEGQLLPIAQNAALFSLLGTTYGGDGIRTFALPDLRGRVALGVSDALPLGTASGEAAVTLNAAQMPQHSHATACRAEAGTQRSPENAVWAADAGGNALYAPTADATMAAAAGSAGGSQPHSNMQPYQCLYWVIALQGIFPSRD